MALFLLYASAALSQDLMFGKFLGSINPVKFTGNSKYKLYEKQVEVIEYNTTGQNQNTTINLKFSPCPASADFLAALQTAKNILNGQVTVLQDTKTSFNKIKYIIYFEDAKVLSCNEAQACDRSLSTTVQLKPSKVCWVYYNYDLSGKLLNTTTNGFDTKNGQSWAVTPPNF